MVLRPWFHYLPPMRDTKREASTITGSPSQLPSYSPPISSSATDAVPYKVFSVYFLINTWNIISTVLLTNLLNWDPTLFFPVSSPPIYSSIPATVISNFLLVILLLLPYITNLASPLSHLVPSRQFLLTENATTSFQCFLYQFLSYRPECSDFIVSYTSQVSSPTVNNPDTPIYFDMPTYSINFSILDYGGV